MFQHFWDTIKWVECHEEGSRYDFLFQAQRYAQPAAHASGPGALLQTCSPAVAEGPSSSRFRSCTEQQINLAVAWMQFTAYKTDYFPVRFCSRSGLHTGGKKKPPMHESGSQIQLWLRPSGRGPSRVTGTVQATALSSQQGRASHGHPEPLPVARSAPRSSPDLPFVGHEWYHLQFLTLIQQFLTTNHIFHPR